MLVHPNFSPIALEIGPLAIRWYGLMYLLAFVQFFMLGRYRIKRYAHVAATGMTAQRVEDLLFYGALGVVLGGRLGYVLFYKPAYYLSHPLEILAVWQGGMSFHGGLLGVIVACWLYGRRRQIHSLDILDFVAPLAPLGLAAGRMGNFINGELWGRPSSLPWAMIFPQAGDNIARHPSQLYQFVGEGLLLFVLVWWFSSKPRARGAAAAVFAIGYAAFRFAAEFARQPDAFLGFLAGGLTMGQLLCIPLLLVGGWLYLMPSQKHV
jgi:phosphatidylglycerol---prolipoprotein diacylglyceryl transferase